jgi:hypothetical protein
MKIFDPVNAVDMSGAHNLRESRSALASKSGRYCCYLLTCRGRVGAVPLSHFLND